MYESNTLLPASRLSGGADVAGGGGVAPHGTLAERKSDLLGFPEREHVRVMRRQDPGATGDKNPSPCPLPQGARGSWCGLPPATIGCYSPARAGGNLHKGLADRPRRRPRAL